MINNNRSIENAWSMLKYLYDELRTKRFRAMDISKIETLDNLYALIISTWCASLAKEGLYKEYVTHEDEEMSSPQGQINIQESIARQTQSRGTLICSYDELSEDIYLNHVLKGTLQYLLWDSSIDKSVKTEIQKTMQLFNGVGFVDINFIHWKDIKFNNSNIRYKHLIEICKTLLAERKLEKTVGLDDNRRLYILFKKQLLKYFKIKYGEEDAVDIFEQPYTLDSEPLFETQINREQRMVAIRTETHALIVMIRLQDEQSLEDSTLGRKRLHELVKYLREYKKLFKLKTSGVIVYVNIDKNKLNLQPITVNNVNDYMVGETVVDIHDQWRFITNKIDDAYKYFIQRNKNKNVNKAENSNKK